MAAAGGNLPPMQPPTRGPSILKRIFLLAALTSPFAACGASQPPSALPPAPSAPDAATSENPGKDAGGEAPARTQAPTSPRRPECQGCLPKVEGGCSKTATAACGTPAEARSCTRDIPCEQSCCDDACQADAECHLGDLMPCCTSCVCPAPPTAVSKAAFERQTAWCAQVDCAAEDVECPPCDTAARYPPMRAACVKGHCRALPE